MAKELETAKQEGILDALRAKQAEEEGTSQPEPKQAKLKVLKNKEAKEADKPAKPAKPAKPQTTALATELLVGGKLDTDKPVASGVYPGLIARVFGNNTVLIATLNPKHQRGELITGLVAADADFQIGDPVSMEYTYTEKPKPGRPPYSAVNIQPLTEEAGKAYKMAAGISEHIAKMATTDLITVLSEPEVMREAFAMMAGWPSKLPGLELLGRQPSSGREDTLYVFVKSEDE